MACPSHTTPNRAPSLYPSIQHVFKITVRNNLTTQKGKKYVPIMCKGVAGDFQKGGSLGVYKLQIHLVFKDLKYSAYRDEGLTGS